MEALLLVTITINIALAPVSKRNYAHSAKSNLVFKAVSTILLLIYSLWLLSDRGNPYASIVTWTLFIQSAQLIIGKVMITNEKAKEQ